MTSNGSGSFLVSGSVGVRQASHLADADGACVGHALTKKVGVVAVLEPSRHRTPTEEASVPSNIEVQADAQRLSSSRAARRPDRLVAALVVMVEQAHLNHARAADTLAAPAGRP